MDLKDRLDELRTALAPEFAIVRPLGEGSMAHVFLARERALQRLVAIKVLKPERAKSDQARKRFERESRSAAKIRHRNVATVYRVGSLADETPFIAMEYVEGRNLAEVLQAEGPMSIEQAGSTLSQIARALAAAHETGVIHRDVKPENVVRESGSGRAVLMDFGIAGILETGSETMMGLTQHGELLGDPQYMSPEQILGEVLTVESDLYGLGVLGYRLLTLEFPYEATTGLEMAKAHWRKEPIPLASLRADADPYPAQLLERCLAKNPLHRPRASDLADALEKGPVKAAVPEAAEAHAPGRPKDAHSKPEMSRRRLSAIMFTDMVGFTALMQEDERRAKSIRDRHRMALRSSVETHGGEIVQFYGDGTLSVFSSAVDAVSSAVAAQRALQQDPAIPVRIGLHIGDINRDEDGIYGDGVNVAARIEGLSVPGAVMISGKVFDEIKNHPELPATPLGEFALKNVRRPVRVFAITAPGLVVPERKSMVAQSGGATENKT